MPKSKERLILNGENVPLTCQSSPVSLHQQHRAGPMAEIVVCELAWILGLVSS